VVVYASRDNQDIGGTRGDGSDLAQLVKENLWLYDDLTETAPRVYAIDWSGNYTLPAIYAGTATSGAYRFPRPIVMGEYTTSRIGNGPQSIPARHSWNSEHAEVRPDTMLGLGGLSGAGLTASQLSTFKVVRTAAHYECIGYFDVFNAYDDVTLSFGPCHWTMARCSGDGQPDERRELPAFLAYLQHHYGATYVSLIQRFGFEPQRTWPLAMGEDTGTYNDRIMVQLEDGERQMLCGSTAASIAERFAENAYAKNWHVFYRFQMACRTSGDVRRCKWNFARVRIRDILDKTFVIDNIARRVGDYVTSEKGVAMLLRWHIFRPGHLFRGGDNRLRPALINLIDNHPGAPSQAREVRMLNELRDRGAPTEHMQDMRTRVNVPQYPLYPYYALDLDEPTLSENLRSFHFEPPPP